MRSAVWSLQYAVCDLESAICRLQSLCRNLSAAQCIRQLPHRCPISDSRTAALNGVAVGQLNKFDKFQAINIERFSLTLSRSRALALSLFIYKYWSCRLSRRALWNVNSTELAAFLSARVLKRAVCLAAQWDA